MGAGPGEAGVSSHTRSPAIHDCTPGRQVVKSILSTVSRIFTKIESALFSLSAMIFLSIVLITCLDVGMRYFARRPIVWSYPLTNTYLMPALFMFALSTGARYRDHISMSVIRVRMPRRMQHACELISDIAGCALGLLAAMYGMFPLLQAWANDERMPGEDWPLWPAYAIVPIGFGVLACRFLIQCAEALTTQNAGVAATEEPSVLEGFE